MKKIIIIGFIFLLIIGLVTGLGTLRNFTVKETKMTSLGYEVELNEYNIEPVFEEEEYNKIGFDIVSAIEQRIIQAEINKQYDSTGCSTTAWCHNNGWLDDTVCYKGRCHDADKTYQLDVPSDSKKAELDEALGIGGRD